MKNKNFNNNLSISDEDFKDMLYNLDYNDLDDNETESETTNKGYNNYHLINEHALYLFQNNRDEEAFKLLDEEADNDKNIFSNLYTIINYYVGRCFEFGIGSNGVPDYDNAKLFYNLVISEPALGSNETVREAYYELAKKFVVGDLFEKNKETAIDLLQKAVSYGSVKAQQCLDIVNRSNQSTYCDEQADDYNDTTYNNQQYTTVFDENHKLVDCSNYTPLQFAENEYSEILESGDYGSLTTLGIEFLNEGLNDSDWMKGVQCLTKAAHQNYGIAQINLAYCYFNGYGVDVDLELANFWLNRGLKNLDSPVK